MKKILGLICLIIIFCNCSKRIIGEYRISVSPPYSDFKFRLNKFYHFVNADVYGIYGKGKYSIFNDTLELRYIDQNYDNSTISITSSKDSSAIKQFDFKIIDKTDKLGIIGTNVIFYNANDSIILSGRTDYDGKLSLQLCNNLDFSRILINYVGYEDIELKQEFYNKNNIFIEWKSDWLHRISAKTEKYNILVNKRNIIKLENSKEDTITLIRKKLIERYDKGRISNEEFFKKLK